ncbi:MAG: HAMP domain-containing histidine kinase [Actinobacteria bacterium]|nr:HAMP domain-containing histidine kinase [Actinomycetota bacterium]
MEISLIAIALVLLSVIIFLMLRSRKYSQLHASEVTSLKYALEEQENQGDFLEKQLNFLFKYAFSYVFVIDSNKNIRAFSENVLDLNAAIKSNGNISVLQIFGSSSLDRFLDEAFEARSPLQGTFEIGGIQRSTYSVTISEPISQDLQSFLMLIIRDDTRDRQLEELRKNITTNVSHELKTPLSVISGYIETASAQLEKNDDEKKVNYFLNKALNESMRLNGLISKLLEISRLESGIVKPDRKRIDLFVVVKNTVGLLEPLIQSKSVEIKLIGEENEVTTTADEQMIGQAFYNVIENAVKFSKDKARIVIEAKREDDHSIVSIIDEGPGISKKDLPFIFQRFYRANESRESGLGSGLGLASAKHLLLLNDGNIDVFSEVGRGSTFRIILPAGF